MKIVLITSGQPCLNPRIVKEADALVEAGYEVTLIYQYWNDWATALDIPLLASKKWGVIRVGGSPKKHRFLYLATRFFNKTANVISRKFGFEYNIGELAIGRTTLLLSEEARQIKASLYIAHNLAALPAAVYAAKKNGSKCGFDAEDLHRFEMSNSEVSRDFKLKKFIEEKYYPRTDYRTTSSIQIANQYKELFPKLTFAVILNVFARNLTTNQRILNNSGAIKLIWFSQNIGLSRGLQDVLAALKILEKHEIEFHVLGYLSKEINIELEQLIKTLNFSQPPKIFFYPPIAPDALYNFASQFDIGLATEPAFSKNNDSALSNKIFTYIQSGLSLIVSDTTAQKQLLEEYPDMGMIYKKSNPDSLAKVLQTYIDDRALLLKHQQRASQYAEKILNWEVEKQKFLSIVKKTLDA